MDIHTASALVKIGDLHETVDNTHDQDIRGRHVKDRDGKDLGHISDLLVDQAENKVQLLEIASGGFLGLGQEKVYIPVDAITSIEGETVTIDLTREHIAGAPEYDPDLVHERSVYDGIWGYYGYETWWTPGYAYPTLPSRPYR